MKNSTTPKWAKQKNKAARHAARIRMARQWLPSYTGTHLVRAYREKFKVDVPTALNDLEEIGALTPEQALNLTHKFIWISSCFYAILKKKR